MATKISSLKNICDVCKQQLIRAATQSESTDFEKVKLNLSLMCQHKKVNYDRMFDLGKKGAFFKAMTSKP